MKYKWSYLHITLLEEWQHFTSVYYTQAQCLCKLWAGSKEMRENGTADVFYLCQQLLSWNERMLRAGSGWVLNVIHTSRRERGYRAFYIMLPHHAVLCVGRVRMGCSFPGLQRLSVLLICTHYSVENCFNSEGFTKSQSLLNWRESNFELESKLIWDRKLF